MNYPSMKLSELKKVAKERGGIKGYYTMSKKELISYLEMPQLPEWLVVTKMTVDTLRELAGQRRLRGYWGYSKAELIATLFPRVNLSGSADSKTGSVDCRTAQEHHEDHREADKHENPQYEDSEKIGI